MSDRRRFLLVLVIGTLMGAGALVIIVRQPPAQAVVDSPILVPVAGPTTTGVPTTAAAAGLPQPDAPVNVPASGYAPEPIQEIGTIEIPKIGLVYRIFHGVTLNNINRGPSHWPGTAMPGETGNSVFAGHRTTYGAPFRRIDELVAGDEIFFTVAGIRSRYLVTGNEIVTPDRLDIVRPTPTPTATLFACHPPGSARFRYVVRAALAAT